MNETSGGPEVLDIFTKASHHANLSVFFTAQNLFHRGKHQRDISLNSNYLALLKNSRDKTQIKHLARQLCPENSKFVVEAYNDATLRPHGYLVVNLQQSYPEILRLRTNIFPHEAAHQTVYAPKGRSVLAVKI